MDWLHGMSFQGISAKTQDDNQAREVLWKIDPRGIFYLYSRYVESPRHCLQFDEYDSLNKKRVRCLDVAAAEFMDLEKRIEMDIQQSFEAFIQEKIIVINDILKFLQENFSEDINAGRIFLSSHGTTEKKSPLTI
jgi:hypothetical protein